MSVYCEHPGFQDVADALRGAFEGHARVELLGVREFPAGTPAVWAQTREPVMGIEKKVTVLLPLNPDFVRAAAPAALGMVVERTDAAITDFVLKHV